MGKIIITFLLLFPAFCYAQNAKTDTLWEPMKFFAGQWTGAGEGEPGQGNYERSYNYILGGSFVEVKNKAAYPAKGQKGKIHEDIGYLSYDKGRKTFVLRQFHAEGFVNTYVLDSISQDKKTIVFITEQIENIPPGWRARETYTVLSNNEFIETFELAEPSQDFLIYTKTTFKRR